MGKCFHTTTVKAPISEVWETLSNFHSLDWAAGAVESLEKIGDKGPREIGAKRKINGVISETLQSIDNENHHLTYSIDDGPGPLASAAVTRYTGAVRLLPITFGEGTFIQWTSEYETEDDGAVGEFCNPIYLALLGKLRETFGA